MTKKSANTQEQKPTAFGDLFSDLKIDNLPPPPEKQKPIVRPPTKEEQMTAALSKEDQQLLKAFGGAQNAIVTPDAPKKGPQLKMNIERKGHHGKTVTLVFGLKELSLEEQMTLSSQIKAALGIGARFLDGVLELQGDQRTRAEAFFLKHNFRIG